MASHVLAIAKASLAAGFIRPDPVPVSRDEVSFFHDALETTLTRCTPANIQRCKDWLVNSGISSSKRVTSVGKYLVTLSSSLGKTEDEALRGNKKGSSSRRKQLHIIYLLNDLLHHFKYHAFDNSAFPSFAQSIRPYLTDLVSHAAAHDPKVYVRQQKRVEETLQEWGRQRYFDASFIEGLRESVKEAGSTGKIGDGGSRDSKGRAAVTSKGKKELPFVMPTTHGDPSAPYYELPAGNMMPHIIPNTSIPISTKQMRPLQFTPDTADPKLIRAVQSFLKEADAIYSLQEQEDEGISMEMDEIGQSVVRDKITGEVIGGESYYGWSTEFCENMKRKEKGGNRRSRSSSSRDRSASPRKRPRYASSNSSRRRSRSRSYSRSRSHSRSPPPRSRRNQRSPSYPRSRSRSRSKSQPRTRSRSSLRFARPRSPSRSPTPSRSFAPPNYHQPQQPPPPGPPPMPPQYQHQMPPQHPPPPQQAFPFTNPFPNGIPPLGPDGLPLPPPRPPNWTGPWPPPPPPPPSHSPNAPQHFGPPQGMQAPFPPPPPPPGPPPPDSYGQGQGGGPGFGYGYGGGYGGRGGMRGRGRGAWR